MYDAYFSIYIYIYLYIYIYIYLFIYLFMFETIAVNILKLLMAHQCISEFIFYPYREF
jgi:hypothetical protein